MRKAKGFGKSPDRANLAPALLNDLLQQAYQYSQAGELDRSQSLLEKVLQSVPGQPVALHGMGVLYLRRGQREQAIDWLGRAVAARPDWVEAHLNLGTALREQGRWWEASTSFRLATQLKPDSVLAWHNLVKLQVLEEKFEEAVVSYQAMLALRPDVTAVYSDLGNVLHALRREEEAVEIYRRGLLLAPESVELHYKLANAFKDQGKTTEALASYSRCRELNPDFAPARWRDLLYLPVLYDDAAEIPYWRERFEQGLEQLVVGTALATEQERRSALAGSGSDCNFYLQYQYLDDLEPQARYAALVHEIVTANFPQWATAPTVPVGEKIRIGYVSGYLWNHNGARWALGWLKNCDRSRFEVYSYHMGGRCDQITERFRQSSDHFHHFPQALEAACHQIRADRLHVLVFTDINMFPLTTQMAALRLAPVQCTTVGHPVTTGLPTLEYYLSSEAMEPENADDHYTETLVLLPKLAWCYEKPVLASSPRKRADYSLPEERTLYLCSQSLFKYLPQYDLVFPRIALEVPDGLFLFVSHPCRSLTERFWQRLVRAFRACGLDAEQYCLILPRMSAADFLELNRVADVFLDTFGWSGANTTMGALACHLPVVTCPGRFMRSRHSYGMLRVLEIDGTVATDVDSYVEIAVRLARQPEWRAELRRTIAERHERLFEDTDCVRALEAFFEKVVACHPS